jgi:glyoxylase-like metal-dependent hydrolase (beta-lactamase superfamily II)
MGAAGAKVAPVGRTIDLMHLGHGQVIAAYERDGLVIDPGPESCLDTLLAGLEGEEPRALLLTHIHLDHAGASGALVRRYPALQVYVHEVGAPHVIDPSKLVTSAGRLYGEDNMARLWGEVLPVPEQNVHVLSGGETVEGYRVGYTPGHAYHHVTYFSEQDGEAFTGDVAGVRVAPSAYVAPPTPPPEVNLEAWSTSLDLLEEWDPQAVCLTHFGRFEGVPEHLARLREQIERWAERARTLDRDAFVAEGEAEFLRDAGPDAGQALLQSTPPWQSWLGLERYWRKRAQRDEAELAGEAG